MKDADKLRYIDNEALFVRLEYYSHHHPVKILGYLRLFKIINLEFSIGWISFANNCNKETIRLCVMMLLSGLVLSLNTGVQYRTL